MVFFLYTNLNPNILFLTNIFGGPKKANMSENMQAGTPFGTVAFIWMTGKVIELYLAAVFCHLTEGTILSWMVLTQSTILELLLNLRLVTIIELKRYKSLFPLKGLFSQVRSRLRIPNHG